MTKKLPSLAAALGGALACACAMLAPAAHAADQAISVQNAWVRWLPGNLPAAGYLTLRNDGDKNVDLVDVDSNDYGSVMLHQTISNGSTQKMVMVDKLTVPAHGSVSVAPGGYHLMLEEPKHKIAPGDTVHIKLEFSNGATLDTPFAVKTPAQQ
ncbi:MAG: copper chaperone PCu(A)C [Paraburkholderia sp.]|uniref:copper chaperone PCu(A)C n=1 Tax=Paraburkholderia sp. TaxID=1926495 RepID=UPI0012099509|nr:copper chaperone PCu(A)C [Paraburkholderia sp.]TAM05464.1 MAG: copper chaperone PCu(A)C [Paraburkholderia sp.]TAM27896.1 MAG: copper chaperone PCu(A)C [Paraburkholderia sp.]